LDGNCRFNPDKVETTLSTYFRDRTLAAYSLYVLASVDIDTATSAIVDGYDDNGIDAVLFEKNENILWLVQSKWIEKGNGEPETGETMKFTKGIRDLVNNELGRFNSKVRAKQSEIEEALDNAAVRIGIILAYTGSNLTAHNRTILDDLLAEQNDPSELVAVHVFSLREAHSALTGSIAGNPIKCEIALMNWGQCDEPYKAFYGTVNAADIAPWWAAHRARLFSDNIRNFIGMTVINESITNTLTTEPQNFWYFNNGITILSDKITKKPLGGGDKSVGYFVCEGVKVVNGAQTVGCIGQASGKSPETLQNARVLVRLISLENCPEDFSVKITKATNTQNRIEKRDFVTLDPQQNRLKTELLLEGKVYHYIRTDEIVTPDDNNYTLEESTIALACQNEDITLAVLAKRELGKLWEDITREPYTLVFSSSTTALQLQRAVKVLRVVNVNLKSKEKSTSPGRERSFYVHANRFILHLAFRLIPTELILDPSRDFDKYVAERLPGMIDKLTTISRVKMEKLYPEPSLVHQVFRNFTKCKEIKLAVLTSKVKKRF
jgi:hypothetical protein